MPERGKYKSTNGVSIRDTGDTPGTLREKSSDGWKRERAYENKIRKHYLGLEDSSNSDLFPPSHVRKVCGYGNLTFQVNDSLVKASNLDSPSLRSRRYERAVPKSTSSEQKQLTVVINTNKSTEAMSRTMLGGFFPPFFGSLCACRYRLYMNMTKNIPAVGTSWKRAVRKGAANEKAGAECSPYPRVSRMIPMSLAEPRLIMATMSFWCRVKRAKGELPSRPSRGHYMWAFG
jgi:hypothetical protein